MIVLSYLSGLVGQAIAITWIGPTEPKDNGQDYDRFTSVAVLPILALGCSVMLPMALTSAFWGMRYASSPVGFRMSALGTLYTPEMRQAESSQESIPIMTQLKGIRLYEAMEGMVPLATSKWGDRKQLV
ncbi:hypothetical protein RQP46_005794 [Phenoliferia psychrophenolica]